VRSATEVRHSVSNRTRLDGSKRQEDNQLSVSDVSQRRNEALSVREMGWMGQPVRRTTRCESMTSAKEELRHSVIMRAQLDGSVRVEENDFNEGG